MSLMSSIALSGMNAAQLGLRVSAHNIANADTPGFRRQQALHETAVPAGVQSSVVRAPVAGAALEADVVGQLQAKNAFLANLAVFRTAQRLSGTLLDALA